MKLFNKIFNSTWNLFSSKDKTLLYIFLLIILGFTLRALIGGHIAPSADETVYGTHAINFINSGAVSNQNQSPLWFFLADFLYKIFGITLFSARLTSIIFSTLTILLVFLLGKELFNKKIAVLAAFLFTISGFSKDSKLLYSGMAGPPVRAMELVVRILLARKNRIILDNNLFLLQPYKYFDIYKFIMIFFLLTAYF